MTDTKRSPIVDVHSHLYPPQYISLLQSRSEIPYVKSFPPSDLPCLCNRPHPPHVPGTPPPGRPLHAHYYDVDEKIKFMDKHGIDISVLSLGNPWLDFLPATSEAAETAKDINDAMNEICMRFKDRLFFFAALPFSASEEIIINEIRRIKKELPQVRGIVMGTGGLQHFDEAEGEAPGDGLDDPSLINIYRTLAEEGLPVFLHPNYGLPGSVWGKRGNDYGQILQLSLGFTMETTIAVTRLFLSGCFSKVPDLQMILSHAGGTLPFLAGRVEACIEHDRQWDARGKLVPARQTIWDVLRKNIYLDAVIFDHVGLKTAIDASGVERVMFGTDHPFFAPVKKEQLANLWPAMTLNQDAVKDVFGKGDEAYNLIMGGNAVRALNLR